MTAELYIRRVRRTEESIEVWDSQGNRAEFIDRSHRGYSSGGRLVSRTRIGEVKVETIEDFRTLTDFEKAIFNNIQTSINEDR